jgi:general stress protein 26
VLRTVPNGIVVLAIGGKPRQAYKKVAMTRNDLIQFLRRYKLAVQASVARGGAPQAAVVGFAVSDSLEIVFDTVTTSRKYQNLRAEPRIALVIGWDDEITAQIEGLADFPAGDELDRIRECYFVVYPDGRDRLSWPVITHVRVRPTWVRYSDFTRDPPHIVELGSEQLR